MAGMGITCLMIIYTCLAGMGMTVIKQPPFDVTVQVTEFI